MRSRWSITVWEEPGRLVTRSPSFRVAAVVPWPPAIAISRPCIRASAIRRRSATGIRLSDRPAPDPPCRRSVLAAVSHDAESVHPARNRAAALAVAIRRADVDSRCAGRGSAARRRRARRSNSGSGQHIDPLATGLAVRDVRAERPGRVPRRDRLRRRTSSTSASSSSFRRCCSQRCSSSLGSSSVRARSVCCARSASDPAAVRRLFLSEGMLLALAGSALGILGAHCLRRAVDGGAAVRGGWMPSAPTALTLHVSLVSLARRSGRRRCGGGRLHLVDACAAWQRSRSAACWQGQLTTQDPRASAPTNTPVEVASDGGRVHLVAPDASCSRRSASHCWRRLRRGVSIAAGALLWGRSALLAASLCLFAAAVPAPARRAVEGRGWRAVSRLGLRNATYRPGRSVLSMAVIASATFILISVDAFRRDATSRTGEPAVRHSAAMRCSSRRCCPIVHDPNTREGREALNLGDLERHVRAVSAAAWRRCELSEPV